ncbi:MAG: glycoside hydrolase family 108 protein [Halanaerobiales bacterium]
MDKVFQEALKHVLEFEGGYSDHEADSGGKTRYGITEKVARKHGYEGDMKDFDVNRAKEIYYRAYWKEQNYHKIKDKHIAIEMFDQAVNMGPKTANKNLQKSYNILTKDNIAVDGIIGSQTLWAINNYKRPDYIFNMLNAYQARHYINLVEDDESQKVFIKGWIKRVVIDWDNYGI